MKRMICLVFCLTFLTGIAFAQKIELGIWIDNITRSTKLQERAIIVEQTREYRDYRMNRGITSFQGLEIVNRLCAELVLSIGQFKIYGFGGIGKTDSEIFTPMIDWKSGYGGLILWDDPAYEVDSMSGKGEFGPVLGAGITIPLLKNIHLNTEYIYQSSGTDIVLMEWGSNYSYPETNERYHQKSVVTQIKSRELNLSFLWVKQFKRFKISAGSILNCMWSNYQGAYVDEWFFFSPYGQAQKVSEGDIDLKVLNDKLLSGLIKIECSINEKTKLVMTTTVGAQNRIAASIIVKLF